MRAETAADLSCNLSESFIVRAKSSNEHFGIFGIWYWGPPKAISVLSRMPGTGLFVPQTTHTWICLEVSGPQKTIEKHMKRILEQKKLENPKKN